MCRLQALDYKYMLSLEWKCNIIYVARGHSPRAKINLRAANMLILIMPLTFLTYRLVHLWEDISFWD